MTSKMKLGMTSASQARINDNYEKMLGWLYLYECKRQGQKDKSMKGELFILFVVQGEDHHKYTVELNDESWTPYNSNLHMQGIKVRPE